MNDLPKKILHVDDDFALRELVRAVFDEVEGFELITCENGRWALEQLETYSPDLILLDLSMPDMDGPEFLKTLQTNDRVKGTPVIFITQFDNITVQGRYQELGVLGVLHKPIDPNTLLDDIRAFWKQR